MEFDNKFIEEEIWFSAVDKESLAKYDKEAAFALFQQRVCQARKRRGRTLRWMSYAAAIAIVAGMTFFSYKAGQTGVISSMKDIVVEAPTGSRSKLTLPDGTSVWLNAGSRISYSQDFGYDDRAVKLDGEAYFEVTHNEKRPFSVESKDLTVKVLGTKFNFKDYKSDNDAVVTLSSGRVSVDFNLKSDNSTVYLSPNQRCTFNKETGKAHVETINSSHSTAWTNGTMIFVDESLAGIIKTLERNYNVKFEVVDKNLYKLSFYGDFSRNGQSIDDILNALSATGKLKYTRNNNKVKLYK